MAVIPHGQNLWKIFDILLILAFEVVFIVLSAIFCKYETHESLHVYPMFQDVHIMIFIGFGFLMTFLKRYGFSAVGYNFLLAALVVQWAILCHGFFHLDKDNKIPISIESILSSDVASATVLISMGALLGRTSCTQLILMGIIEIFFYVINIFIAEKYFIVTDAGDSMFVHCFGAYFGLGVSFVLNQRRPLSLKEEAMEGSSYMSDMFAMIGTIFLWAFWPSFNSAELHGDTQHRAVINTYLALSASCVVSYALSSAFTQDRKFDMVHIQNSTLAGGVAIGTSAHMMVHPFGALLIGSSAGVISVLGYCFLTPALNKYLNVKDTCGVHNLHGMPAVFAGLVGAFMAFLASEKEYNKEIYTIFPAMAASNLTATPEYPFLAPGMDRTATAQAGFQLAALGCTMGISIASGLITGFIVSLPIMSRLNPNTAYMDDPCWLIHEHHEGETVNEQERV